MVASTSTLARLMKFARKGEIDKFNKKLIEYDVSANATNAKGRTALMYAAEFGQYKMVKELLSKYPEVSKNAGMWSNIGDTALMAAHRKKHRDITRLLIENEDVRRHIKHPNKQGYFVPILDLPWTKVELATMCGSTVHRKDILDSMENWPIMAKIKRLENNKKKAIADFNAKIKKLDKDAELLDKQVEQFIDREVDICNGQKVKSDKRKIFGQTSKRSKSGSPKKTKRKSPKKLTATEIHTLAKLQKVNDLMYDPHYIADFNKRRKNMKGSRMVGTGRKKVRKHKGIYQSGVNKGKLKPRYRYNGKKTKTGLPVIIKSK